MKKADTNVLLAEELTDLLYELNDIYNVQREVVYKYPEFFTFRLSRAIIYVAYAIEFIHSDRTGSDVLEETIKPIEQEGYLDKTDLLYVTQRANDHFARIQMAYSPEIDCYANTLLKIIENCLKDINEYI